MPHPDERGKIFCQDLHGQDPDSAKHCMDIEANELIMVTKRGKVGWTFGKVSKFSLHLSICNSVAGEPVQKRMC